MNCKEAKVLSIPYILGDLNDDPQQYYALENHLASCQGCTEAYKTSKNIIEFIRRHRTEFAEAIESIEAETHKKQVVFRRIIRAGFAAAACIAIGLFVRLAYYNPVRHEAQIVQKAGVNPALSIKIELASENHKILSAGAEIRTAGSELKTLIINNKHHIVMNKNTSLSVEPLHKNKATGCIVRLNSGEIFANVESGGCPFVVSTAYGRAIITGTTFDVKTIDDSMTLVVTEGTVQFESESGFQIITSGQISRIVGRCAPIKPKECNSNELTAWAMGEEIKNALTKINPVTYGHNAGGFDLTMSYGTISLDSINYEDWIRKKEDWFRQYFPSTFLLRDALRREKLNVNYPELLIQSGNIWKLIHPENLSSQIRIVSEDSLIKAARRYGFDKQWLLIHLSGYAGKDLPGIDHKLEVLRTFDKWLDYLKEANKSSKELDTDTILYSLNASIYLANTRTLIWLCVKNDRFGCKAQEKAHLLSLLEEEISASIENIHVAVELMTASNNLCLPEYNLNFDQMAEKIGVIRQCEKEIVTNGYCE